MKFRQGRHPTTTALIDPPRLRDCNSDCNRHLNCQVHAISVSVLVSFSLRSVLVRVFCPAGQWVVICPYQRLRCILYSLCLPGLDLPGHAASPRLASSRQFWVDRSSHWQPVSTCSQNACCAHFFSLSTPDYTYTASQNPCLTFNHHLSLFSVSALRPPSGVLISPPGSGTLICLRLPVNSLSRNNPSPHILLFPSHWRREDP